jgi:hypothetical protein
MIIQTAPAGAPRLAIMMYEHTALCGQFARAFGNDAFEPLAPLELMVYVVAHHDAGWAEFDRDPVTDEKTSLPIQSHRDARAIHHGHQPIVARLQSAAAPILRLDIEHA